MPQQLVVTAIGADRTGLVSRLARLVTDCNCNIVDSRMAIFGSEFTFIMLLSGDAVAISRIEYLLPGLGYELDLLTMTKRTTARPTTAISAHYVLEYTGKDEVGTLGAITTLLANHQIHIGALRTETLTAPETGQLLNHCTMTVQLPQGAVVEAIRHELFVLLQELQLTGRFEAQL
ncbi:transcriptional regulator [Rheinheimera sediminis]|uniref:glycine cleavage system protein R n=1 Tax=Rheinheimera sp. YQF-1 TaxID=2499626 RepID=UPI000FDAFE05|nr:ACT domain-containing protein [Rheinheimera sp. YQF-1]RVT49170.1 transcriptional regulator [Rheinheimera sp. YQF-1]